MTTPAEKDAMALAVLAVGAQHLRNAKNIKACHLGDAASELEQARAHLAARVAELEEAREVLFGGLDRDRDNITTRNLAVVAINALAIERDRATRAEAELAAVLAWLAKLESFVGPGALAYMRREFDAARGAG